MISIDPDTIGFVAATLTTVAFVPQVWKVWQTRSTQDISLGMYLFFTSGVVMWLLYGVLLGAWPIIIANGITVLLAGGILGMKVSFR